ncbi:MAG: bacteriophage Gp15 family protein [Oscillospiraceae bacterium]|nr:bacteriophage Gp15 family protein [Oscillospiraceae bacterium]
MNRYGDIIFTGLSDCITVGGRDYPIRSDHRSVLILLGCIETGADISDMTEYFFIGDVPENGEALMLDFIGREYIPAKGNAFSFYGDFGLIFGAFMECYGINLFRDELHWHEFTALFMSLSSDCAFSKLIKCRCGDFPDGRQKLRARRIVRKYNNSTGGIAT